MSTSVAQRLSLLMLAAALGLLLITGIGPYQMDRVDAKANYRNENTVPSLLVLADVDSSFGSVQASLWRHIAAAVPAKKQEIEQELAATKQEAAA